MESNLIEPLIGVIGTALTGVLLALIKHFLTKSKIQITEQQEKIIREIIKDSVAYAESWALTKAEKPKAAEKLGIAKIRVKGAALRRGLIDHDLVKDDEMIENGIERVLNDRRDSLTHAFFNGNQGTK